MLARGTRRAVAALRWAVGLGLALVAMRLLLAPAPAPVSAASFPWLWFGVAVGLGLAIGRWWAAPLPPLLVPLGLWYKLHTGYIAFLGESWLEITLALIALGFAGTAMGVGLHRGLRPNVTPR